MEAKIDYSFYKQAKYKLTLSISTAVFFMLFFLVFQPFGVNNYSTERIFTLEFVKMLSAIMILIFSVLLFNEFVIQKWFINKITLWKIVAWSIWTCILLGLVTFLFYNWVGNWHDFSIFTAVEFVIDLTSVSIFPIVGTFFYFRYQNLHNAFQQVVSNRQERFDRDQLIHFEGQGVNDNLMISIADFIYGKAQDNYVELVYRKNDKITRTLIRVPLSVLAEKVASEMIVKCHRSYIVNLFNVKAVVKGTDMKLFFDYIDYPIRVSKSYRQEVEGYLRLVKNFN